METLECGSVEKNSWVAALAIPQIVGYEKPLTEIVLMYLVERVK